MSRVGPTEVTVKVRGTATVTVRVKQGRKKKLIFGRGNAKLGKNVKTFSLPAGWSCPFASDCLARANRQTGKITDGPDTEFRCFAASDEARHTEVRRARWHNLGLVRGLTGARLVELILASMPAAAYVVRIHVSGDFISQDYFDAWLEVARRRPDVRFYAYTKSLRYWVARLDEVGTGHTQGKVPNFVLTASRGGREDELIDQHGLRWARVVFSKQEAATLGLDIDHDDTHAQYHGPDFALLIHGAQPAGSMAGKAVAALRAQGEYGYGRKADEARRKHGRVPLTTL